MNDWILMEDSLPKENEEVLVASYDGDICIGKYCSFFKTFITAESKGHEIEVLRDSIAWHYIPEFNYKKIKCKNCIYFNTYKHWEHIGKCKVTCDIVADIQTCKKGRTK